MQKSAKYALIAVVVVIVVGGAGFWWFVLRDDAPSRASLPVRTEQATTTTAAAGGSRGAVADASSPTGSWKVQPGENVFVGYRMQELFGGETIKKTAVGRTAAVTGTMTIDGNQITAASITGDVTQLKSDQARRDSAIKNQALETNKFGQATFVLTSPIALPSTAAVGETVNVTATGDLTLHGVTRSVEIPLQARWDGTVIDVAGGAHIVLADYAITPISSGFVAIDDNGEFELQLTFVRA